MNTELLDKATVDFQAIGEEIPHELAEKMIKNHYDAHNGDSNTFVIGKNILTQILAQPGCVALRIFQAKNEDGEETLVYAGVDSKGKTILEIATINENGKLAITPAMIGDKTRPTDSWFF